MQRSASLLRTSAPATAALFIGTRSVASDCKREGVRPPCSASALISALISRPVAVPRSVWTARIEFASPLLTSACMAGRSPPALRVRSFCSASSSPALARASSAVARIVGSASADSPRNRPRAIGSSRPRSSTSPAALVIHVSYSSSAVSGCAPALMASIFSVIAACDRGFLFNMPAARVVASSKRPAATAAHPRLRICASLTGRGVCARAGDQTNAVMIKPIAIDLISANCTAHESRSSAHPCGSAGASLPFQVVSRPRKTLANERASDDDDRYNVALSSAEPQLSIVAARLQRLSDAARFVQQLQREVDALGVPSEIIAVPDDPRGFGYELREGLRQARAPYVITVDPDFSGRMTFLADLWARRDEAEVIVASRYVDGSRINMPAARTLGSRVLNSAFRRGLSVGVNDGSSAIRLYRTNVVNSLQLESTDYDILQEVLVRAYAAGWRVLEIPLDYTPNPAVASKAHAALASAYLRTFWALWKLRNSIAAADYDYRAHDSPIPLQRYWQRQPLPPHQRADRRARAGARCRMRIEPHHRRAAEGQRRARRADQQAAVRAAVSDVRAFAAPASRCRLPTPAFPCVLCSQVIEHVPMVPSMIDELCRVLGAGRTAGARHARLRPVGVGVDREGLWPGRAGRLCRRAHLALHAERTARGLRPPRLHARGDALHPSRRADPGLPETGVMTNRDRGSGPSLIGACSAALLAPLLLCRCSPAASSSTTTCRGSTCRCGILYQQALNSGDSVLWTPSIFAGSTCMAKVRSALFHPFHQLLYRVFRSGRPSISS